jgi:hypothetical protein
MNRNLETTFRTFHDRAMEPVYPFENNSDSMIHFDAVLPKMAHVGRAIRVLYESDKWSLVGDTTGYYHDHGPDDGAVVFSSKNNVKLYAPQKYVPKHRKVSKFPVRWSKELVLLGTCGGWYADDGSDELVEAEVKNSILVCSPFGFVSKKNPERVWLAVIDIDSGVVECLISGPGLTVTCHGIVG